MISRRQFAAVCASGAAALSMKHVLAAEEPNAGKYIDAHVHVWHPDTTKYPISPRFQVSDMQPKSFTDSELLAQARPLGIAKIVLIQMSFYEYDHRYMNEVIAAHPGVFSGVAIVNLQANNVLDQMKQLTSAGSRGFRIHSRGDAPQWPTNDNMATLWRESANKGWAVCPLINPNEIAIVDSMCERFPDTTVVVDHFARVGISGEIRSDDLAQLCRLSRHRNVHVKTSAFYALGKKQPPYDDLSGMIRQVLDAFGPERLMWATDCPYQVQGDHSYAASLELIRDRLDFLSPHDKQWLLRGTAEKVFFGR